MIHPGFLKRPILFSLASMAIGLFVDGQIAVADELNSDFHDDEETEGTSAAAPVAGETEYWDALQLFEASTEIALEAGRSKLETAAGFEFPTAQNFLGGCYLDGSYGFRKNKRKAVEYFRLAAERGNAYAQINLGRAYCFGQGVWKNKDKARLWLGKAVEDGANYTVPDPPQWVTEQWQKGWEESEAIAVEQTPPEIQSRLQAHYLLGWLEADNDNLEAAQEHYLKAARAGPAGQFGLAAAATSAAINFAFGQGVERDLEQANRMLERSRTLGLQQSNSFVHGLSDHPLFDRFMRADLTSEIEESLEKQRVDLQFSIANTFGDEESDDYDPHEAAKWFELAANDGDRAWAMLHLGFMHAEGKLGAPDWSQAAEWFRRASEDGNHSLGTANYWICLYLGLGVPQDQAAAKVIYQEYADTNIVAYLATLGEFPKGILHYDEVFDLVKKWATKRKDPHARYLYGRRYLNGWGVDWSRKKANKWFRRAAKEGHAGAHYELGKAYQYGYGVSWDINKALEHYREAFKGRNSEGAHRLGWQADNNDRVTELFLLPDGPTSTDPKEQAIYFYEKAIEWNPDADNTQNNLGTIYEAKALEARKAGDEISFAASRDKAIALYETSAESGNKYGHYNLGKLAYSGTFGDKDLREAFRRYSSAAEGGHSLSREMVAKMLLAGEGVRASEEEAMHHYRLLALDDDTPGDRRRTSLNQLCNYYLGTTGSKADIDAASFWLALYARLGNSDAIIVYGDLLIKRKQYSSARKYFLMLRRYGSDHIKARAYSRLADIYRGGLGVEKNLRLAEKYLSRAVKGESPAALSAMGRKAFSEGEFSEAKKLWEQAEEQGSVEAIYQLGCLLYAGNGCEQNIEQAFTRFREAADKGFLDAIFNLALAAYQEQPGAPSLEEGLDYARKAENREHPKGREVREALEKKIQKTQSKEPSIGTGQRGIT